MWAPVVPLLAERHPVFGWDLPGHGASPAARDGFSIDDLAEGVLRAADGVGLGRFAAAGASLGGLVSLAVALQAPDRVTSLTMICSLPRIGTPDGWAERAAQVRASGTPALVPGSASRWFAPGFIEREPHLAGGLLTDLTEIDDESYARCAEVLGATDLRERVRDVAAPLTIVAGAADAVVAIPDAEAAVGSARAGRLTVLPGVAHQATVENPLEVAAILTKEVPA